MLAHSSETPRLTLPYLAEHVRGDVIQDPASRYLDHTSGSTPDERLHPILGLSFVVDAGPGIGGAEVIGLRIVSHSRVIVRDAICSSRREWSVVIQMVRG